MQAKQPTSIPFITKNHNHQYEVSAQAIEFLQHITSPISIVTTAGLYRTGKSYLLNRIVLNRSNGFRVGPTVNACTKGLWLWGQVLHSENNNLLVVDTEGLGGLDEQTNHDMKIVCLAVLLSTTFIYNSVGSIDENALQTLSVVLSLVNSIDQENISMKPQLIWLVRDFSLQLINEDGHTITSKEYLELALTSSKQPSKNHIRKIITNSFKHRDCFTIVKPLVDQNKLQNLDGLPLEELRTEFVTQSMKLRKKILSSLKPLTLCKSQPLSGKDYILMAKKYTKVINQGNVPNLLDTWTYLKQQKSRDTLNELQKIYAEKLKNKITNKIPLPSNQLYEIMQQLEYQLYNDFKKMTYQDTSTQQLHKFANEWKIHLQRTNTQLTKTTLTNLLTKQYQPFQKKLLSQYYQDYQQFKEQLKNHFKSFFINKYQDRYDHIHEITQTFINSKLIDAYTIFHKNQINQIQKLNTINIQLQQRMNQQISNIIKANQITQQKLQQYIRQLEIKNVQLQQQKNQIETNLHQNKMLQLNQIVSLQRKNQQLSSTVQKINNEFLLKSNSYNEVQKTLFMKEKEVEKEKALFVQKQQQLQNQLNDLERKYKQIQNQLKVKEGSMDQQKKNQSISFQNKIKLLSNENKSLSQKNYQLEYIIQNNNLTIEKLNDKIQNMIKKHSQQLQSLKDKLQIQQTNNQFSSQIILLQNQIQNSKSQYNIAIKQIKQYEIKYKQINDQYKNIKSNSQKQTAIHLQKIQFQQIQINQLKSNYSDLKKSYQIALQNLQDNSKSLQENLKMKIFQKQNQFQNKFKLLEIEFEQKTKDLKKQLQNISKQKGQLQFNLTLEKQKFQQKEKQLKQALSSLQNLYQKSQSKLANSEKDYQDIFKQKQNYFKLRMKQLELQLDQAKEKATVQITQVQNKSEQALMVLKKYSQMERVQWEKRLIDEKEKSQKRIKSIIQQFQQKMSQQKQTLEDQNSQLQQKISQMHRLFNEKIQNMQYDHDIALQKTVNQFMDERVQLNKNLALANQQLNLTKQNLQNQFQQLKRNYEHNIDNNKRNLMQEHEQAISKINQEKNQLQSKYQILKKTHRQVQQSNLILKNQNQKDKAVYKEKQYHYQKKITQLENTLQTQLQSYNETIEKLNEANLCERNHLNKEIQKLKQLNFQLEQQKNKCISDFETDKNLLLARNNFLDVQWKRAKADYQDIIKKFETTVKHLSQERQNIKYQNDSSRTEIVQTMKDQFERQIAELKQSHTRMLKDSQDRINRYQTQIKVLRDRLALQELRPQSSSFLNNRQVQKMKEQYQQRILHYQKALQKQRRDNRQQSMLKQELERKLSDRSFMEKSQRVSLNDSSISINNKYKDIKGTKFSNTPLINKKPQSGRIIDNEDFTGIKKYKC